MLPEKITGTWYNELGSTMEIQIRGNNIVGTYQTAVGDAEGIYRLFGVGDFDDHASETLGWTVAWNNEFKNSDSVTTWCGQYQVKDGEEIIVTTWLLTTETDPNDDWHSTLIGMDTFYRYPVRENASKGKDMKRSQDRKSV